MCRMLVQPELEQQQQVRALQEIQEEAWQRDRYSINKRREQRAPNLQTTIETQREYPFCYYTTTRLLDTDVLPNHC